MTDVDPEQGSDEATELDGEATGATPNADTGVLDGPAAQPARRWTPGRVKKAERERLSGSGFLMVGNAGGLDWVIRGAKEAALDTVQVVLRHLESLYEQLGAQPNLTCLDIADSVHIKIGPSRDEVVDTERAFRELAEFDEEHPDLTDSPQPQESPGPELVDLPSDADRPREIQDPAPDEPGEDDGEVDDGTDSGERLTRVQRGRKRIVLRTVPNTVLANSVLLDLIRETTDEHVEQPLPEALRLGTGVARHYRGLVNQLAEDGLELEAAWDLDDRSVAVDNERLSQVAEALSAKGTLNDFEVDVLGTLTMADADKLEFRLKFADDAERPDVLRDWHHGAISGTYSQGLRSHITDNGLWNREVTAKLRISREERGSSAARKKPTVTLRQVAARYGDETPADIGA